MHMEDFSRTSTKFYFLARSGLLFCWRAAYDDALLGSFERSLSLAHCPLKAKHITWRKQHFAAPVFWGNYASSLSLQYSLQVFPLQIISGLNCCSVQSVSTTFLSSINYWDCCIWTFIWTHLIVATVSVSICNICKQQLYWNRELVTHFLSPRLCYSSKMFSPPTTAPFTWQNRENLVVRINSGRERPSNWDLMTAPARTEMWPFCLSLQNHFIWISVRVARILFSLNLGDKTGKSQCYLLGRGL